MGWLKEWFSRLLQRHPAVLRSLFRLAEPLLTRRQLFSRARDVKDIFDRPHDFQVGFTIAPKTKLGPFLLSMDEGPRHTIEKRALARAIDRPFATQFARTAKHESDAIAAQLAREARNDQPIDLASNYAERVFVRTLARYFGIPVDGWASQHLQVPPGERTLALFIRTLGATIGCGTHPAPFGLEELALAVSEEFKRQLEIAIENRRADIDETVLGYLFHPRPDQHDLDPQRVIDDAQYVQQDGLARSIGGLLAAGASLPKLFSGVLYELSQHKQLEALVRKAGDAQLSDADWKTFVEPYVLEALRFRPAFPLLIRYCPRAARIGDTEVPAGSDLGFSPLAAMFDPTYVERPDQFIPGRPEDRYFIFGAGPRTCLGRSMMLGLLAPMLRSLFIHLPAIATAPPGSFRYDAAALEHYWVKLPASQGRLIVLPRRQVANEGEPETAERSSGSI
ncbi:MAG TPA: cytochrome P450 [Polyangiales bacterium]|nr:cytochrome P450 [Polyangiales bacterium]